MAEQHRMFEQHPGTTFINAHMGWLANDLTQLGALLDRLPNVYTEIGAVVQELGRQPKFARAFLTKYKERILFGKDTYRPFEYHTYFRTLETGDEYFPYYRKYHAFWSLYGLELPDDVLQHIYYKNALRIIPGLDASLFPGS
jgi:predicted TIM-barrel fold metal-dependent hydrolase